MTSPISSKVALNLVKMIFLCLAYSASYAAEENAWLDNNLDDFLKSNPSVPAIAIVMVQHGKAIMSGSKGVSSNETGNAFTIDTPVRIASVTKLYVAAVIFRLIEENKVSMEDSIADLISSSHAAVLDESGYDLESIKVKHLLSHTSGLRTATMARVDSTCATISWQTHPSSCRQQIWVRCSSSWGTSTVL